MKTLDLNQMESLQGGTACMGSMGLSAVVGGMLFGPVGYFAFAAYAYYASPNCQ